MNNSVLITGCSSGIGHALAVGLRARGHRVFAGARKPEDVAVLRAQGFEAVRIDVDDSVSLQTAVREVLALSGGRLDALVNNAGYGQPGAVEDLPRAALRAQFETNVFGPLELTNLVLPAMRAQGHGRIVNVSSVLGLVAFPYRGAYNASKHALEGLTDTLRLELRGTGILVALVEPGPIASRFRTNAYAAYRKYIDPARSVHREKYLAMERRLTKSGPAARFTLPPQAVLEKVIHALEAPRPKLRYYVTLPTHAISALKRLLPYRALDWIIYKIGGAGGT